MNDNCESNFKEALNHLQKNKDIEKRLVRAFIICSYILSTGIALAVVSGGSAFVYDYFTDKLCPSQSLYQY